MIFSYHLYFELAASLMNTILVMKVLFSKKKKSFGLPSAIHQAILATTLRIIIVLATL
jgi:hypothetical protein